MRIVTDSDGQGRIEVLLGMIWHTLPADMVVAAQWGKWRTPSDSADQLRCCCSVHLDLHG
jgi:hypothetical protein